MTHALDDCFLHDRDRMRHAEVLARLRDGLRPVRPVETVPLARAAGRVAARDVTVPHDVPRHTNAAVDGYAFARTPAATSLSVSMRVTAGAARGSLPLGTAARIFTGAPVPRGADTVVMQEDCERTGDIVTIPLIRAGANVRGAGEDVQAGAVIALAGRLVDAPLTARLASIGADEVDVYRPLRVTLFSTGDELGEDVADANRPMISAMLRHLPLVLTDGGILPDKAANVEAALADAAANHDLVLTTGGASRGEEDHVLEALDRLGTRNGWQIAVKPGRPLMFGRIGDAAFLGLPGNPVAAFVCTLLYARPTILALAGAAWAEPPTYCVPSGFALVSKPDRREFLRGSIENGCLVKFPRDGSGLIASLTGSQGLVVVPEGTTRVAVGDPLDFIPYAGLV